MIATSVQHEFARALRAPGMAAPTALLLGDADAAAHRFAIHRNNFVSTLVDALAESFPVTRALVGDDFFRAMARERILAEPPRSPVLTDYAAGFPAFVAAFEHAQSVPYLGDVAKMEALRIRAFHAADAPPVDTAAYHALAVRPDRLAEAKVRLHPACAWVASPYAIWSIWNAHQGLADPGDADLTGIDLQRAETVLIHRPELEVLAAPIAPAAVLFLDALRDGRPLGQALHAALVRPGHDLDERSLFLLLLQHRLAITLDTQPDASE